MIIIPEESIEACRGQWGLWALDPILLKDGTAILPEAVLLDEHYPEEIISILRLFPTREVSMDDYWVPEE